MGLGYEGPSSGAHHGRRRVPVSTWIRPRLRPTLPAVSEEAKPAETALPRGFAPAFGVTWLSYASYYLGRKGLAVVETSIGKALGPRAIYGVETAYLAAYALGQFPSGRAGDRFGARRLLGAGMLVSALACAAFGATSLWPLFIGLMLINGLAQSTGWPGNIKAMAEWTPPGRRGGAMGLWGTCYQVGGIAATAVATWFLVRVGWRGAFLGPAALLALVGVLVLLFLKPGPLAPKAEAGDPEGEAHLLEQRTRARREVLRSGTIWSYGACYFCIKLIRYALLFGLPTYLETLGYTAERAGYSSTSFEIGGVVGTIALGFASDRWRQVPRSLFATGSLVALAAAFYLYLKVGASSEVVNFAAMALVGALLFGPDALLSGAAAQDAGGPHAAAVAAGVVNGIGSVGGVLQEVLKRTVTTQFGWGTLFYVFVGLSLVAALSLSPTWKGARTRQGVAAS
jgi:MFS transporter, OPA family, sugar phosphate sensor protein UhpC